ncbi:hypothetical protein XELAEV_18046116mg [Xenopus laevis]|uniref:Uncharacterized protein n=1 Tax=Xenopus laevis TaxID=8355 RepID=A0A974BT20_XENLA|nr:hypothetical protein XELAEV_18046116mg [Xenopus laevis]
MYRLPRCFRSCGRSLADSFEGHAFLLCPAAAAEGQSVIYEKERSRFNYFSSLNPTARKKMQKKRLRQLQNLLLREELAYLLLFVAHTNQCRYSIDPSPRHCHIVITSLYLPFKGGHSTVELFNWS